MVVYFGILDLSYFNCYFLLIGRFFFRILVGVECFLVVLVSEEIKNI